MSRALIVTHFSGFMVFPMKLADGLTCVRPRMHPEAREQPREPLAHHSWRSKRNECRCRRCARSSNALARLLGGSGPRYAGSDSQAPTERLLSPDREELLKRIFASFEERSDLCPHISSGLDGTYRVSLYKAIDGSFAAWTENCSPGNLLVRSLVRAI